MPPIFKSRRDRVKFFEGVAPPPRLSPNVGIPPVPPLWVSPKAVEAVKGRDALEGWVSGGAGPTYDRYLSYAGKGLDPNQIDTIFRQADRGQYLLQYGDLWQMLLQRDYQLFTLDRGRRAGIVTKKFQVTASDPGDEVSAGLRNALEAMVDGIDAFDTEGVYSMLAANGPGYSILEVMYQLETLRFPWRGKTVSVQTLNPRQLRYVLPKHAYFAWDTDAPHLNMGSDGNLPLAEAPWKWLYYRTVGDGIASMRGYFRPTAWLHLLGQTSIVSGGIFLKLFGIPQIRAFIKQEMWKDASLKAAIEADLQNYGNGIPTVFPEWMKDRIVAEPGPLASGGVDVHLKFRGFIDACMAKCIQGAVLQVETSGGGPGSYAQSQTHENKSYDVTVVDSVSTCETIRSQLFRNWIKLNADALAGVFGVSPEDLLCRNGRASRRIDRETTPRERAEIMKLFADGGLATSQRQIRNEYALDAPDDEADAFRGEPVIVPSGAVTAAPDDASDGVDNPKPDAESGPSETTPAPADKPKES
jgi:hypothetical protein